MAEPSPISDEALMALAQSGDDQAFEALALRLTPRLYAFIYRHVGSKETAEDLVQETLMRTYKHRHTFRSGCRVSTWVFTMGLNLCRDWGRRKKPFSTLTDSAVAMAAEHSRFAKRTPTPEDLAARNEEAALLLEALQELPALTREILTLRSQQDLKFEELSDRLGLSAMAARTLASRAYKRLKELIEARTKGGRTL
jgi:RNA polymerase sigma factor (sigma-70 family)